MHQLYEVLIAAAGGSFPCVDGGVEVWAPMHEGHHAVVEFTGHSFVLTDHEPAAVLARDGVDGFGGASQPDVLRWLAGPAGRIGTHDAVLVAPGIGGGRLSESAAHDDHPRVLRSREHRRDVRIHSDDVGLVTIGRGLVDRLELSVEVIDPAAPAGSGAHLIAAGRALVPAGEFLFAQVAPGNAASVRAFLRCGFVPIGAETLIRPPTK